MFFQIVSITTSIFNLKNPQAGLNNFDHPLQAEQ
ncbi:hypothetical protein EPIR_2684 [Erwinia piriflorinigrans CFBP 5888]|uniref:Uncharacterized protein n=1 Tax=Erwinia piriflorinigrans CFBP 5888 TaxID=1161919 RepID=V5ZAK2_9GAMM|nr:hypothetical protein EPIR_2684 [Erwinia piriflorinigrans CFBP 5888]